ncbi:MAG TPA: AP2 domain-containing protein [Acidimicrobiales bacterium]|nr:AP2 domain-containing protein [Acidimicrobiales bacterium]
MTYEFRVGQHRAVVDDVDVPLVLAHTWHANPGAHTIYVRTQVAGRKVYLHALILPSAVQVDHVDRNGLNNRRSNLRPAAQRLNAANQPGRLVQGGRQTTSRFKGVSWDRVAGRWRAQVTVDGRMRYLGRFADEVAAAQAYDAAALGIWGEFAALNFLPGPSDT